MKKLLSILLTLSMLFSLCVFGASASNASAAEPTEVTLHATDGQIIISWRNPVWTEANALTEIKLYDGAGTKLETSFDLKSGKIQSYTHKGLTTGNVYSYKLEFTYADRSVIPVKLSSKASKSSLDLYLGTTAIQGDISYHRDTESIPLSVIMDNSEQREGHPTLKLTNHRGDKYGRALLTVNVKNLNKGATYTFSYWQKASAADVKAGRSHLLSFQNGTITKPDSSNKPTEKTFMLDTDKWVQRSVEYKLASDKTTFTVGFVIKSIENFWIDELSLVENGTTTNMLAKRANNNIYKEVAALDTVNEKVITADQVTNTANSNSITTAWEGDTKTPPTRMSSLKFYIKKAGASAYTYAGEAAGQYSGNFVFENLTPGTYYDVKVTKILCGVEVDLKTETINTLVVPVNPDWDVSAYSFKLGDTEVADITQTGAYTASVSVKNVNTTEESLPAQLIAAIYKEGVLQSVVYTDKIDVNKGENETLTKEVTITDADCEVRLFLWDGLDTMKPLAMASEKF